MEHWQLGNSQVATPRPSSVSACLPAGLPAARAQAHRATRQKRVSLSSGENPSRDGWQRSATQAASARDAGQRGAVPQSHLAPRWPSQPRSLVRIVRAVADSSSELRPELSTPDRAQRPRARASQSQANGSGAGGFLFLKGSRMGVWAGARRRRRARCSRPSTDVLAQLPDRRFLALS